MIGLAFYATALFFIESDTGETLSDLGNGILPATAVLLLLRLSSETGRKEV